jgi:hypothetical protein
MSGRGRRQRRTAAASSSSEQQQDDEEYDDFEPSAALAELWAKAAGTKKARKADRTNASYRQKMLQFNKFHIEHLRRPLLNTLSGKLIFYPKLRDFQAFLQFKFESKEVTRATSLHGHRSALGHYMNVNNDLIAADCQGQPWTQDQWDSLSLMQVGLKNVTAQHIRDGEVDGKVGKDHLPCEKYQHFCATSTAMDQDLLREHGLVHSHHATGLQCFGKMMWNLCARSDTAGAMRTSHLKWEGDCMMVGINKSKKHSKEEFEYFALCANPFDCRYCPITSVAMHLACCPSILMDEKSASLWPCADPSGTFGNEFRAVCTGQDWKDAFGLHSFRKVSGVLKYTTEFVSICTCSPTHLYLFSGRFDSSVITDS